MIQDIATFFKQSTGSAGVFAGTCFLIAWISVCAYVVLAGVGRAIMFARVAGTDKRRLDRMESRLNQHLLDKEHQTS
jgi:hypothetical protein